MSALQKQPERYTLPLSAEGYAHANEAFRQCWTADRDEVIAFLNDYMPLTESDSLRILGIGVGDGSFDMRIIRTLRATYRKATIDYVVVEPNTTQLDRFIGHIRADPPSGVHVTMYPIRAEDYQIVAPFDLIHYVHSLYHMPGSEERLIRDAVAGLRPDGRLLIALSAEQGGIYQMMGQFWDRIDYSFFTDGLFGQESLRTILNKLNVVYAEEVYPEVAIDVSECFNPSSGLGRHLLNFLLQADMDQAPQELRHDVLAALDALARTEGRRRLLAHPSGIFVVGAQ